MSWLNLNINKGSIEYALKKKKSIKKYIHKYHYVCTYTLNFHFGYIFFQ